MLTEKEFHQFVDLMAAMYDSRQRDTHPGTSALVLYSRMEKRASPEDLHVASVLYAGRKLLDRSRGKA